MALEVASNILLNVKANTSDAKRKLRDLAGEERKLAKDFIETQERRNAKIDKQIALIGKLAIGVGAAVGAYKTLTASAEFYAKRQQLVAASAGANIGRIQNAAKGLITETQALQFAAAAQNTEFKLTQDQMETVAKAMVSLRNQGNEFTEVQRRLTQAVVEGNVEALRPFGIVIKGTTGELETAEKVMAALTVEAGKLADGVDLAGDAFLRSQVKIDDWVSDVKQGLGEATNEALKLLMAMEQALSRAIGVRSGTASDISRLRLERAELRRRVGDTQGFTPFHGRLREVEEELAQLERTMAARTTAQRQVRLQRAAQNPIDIFEVAERFGEEWTKAGKAVAEDAEKRQASGRGRPIKASILTVEQQMRVDTLLAVKANLPQIGAPGDGAIERLGRGLGDPGSFGAFLEGARGEADAITQGVDQIPESFNAATTAMSAFSVASSSAFQAFIDGSMSAGDIARKFVGDLLSGLATQMFSRSLFHAAEALALIIPGATFNPAGAAIAAKTAAAYAAGAVVVGGLARAYGGRTEGAGSRGGLPAAAVGAGGGTGGGGQSSQTFIVVQDQFDDDPRAARRRLKKAFDRAQGEYRGRPAVVRS